MKSPILLLLLLLPILVKSQDVSKLDAKYGFRDVVFEQPLSAYKEMSFTTVGSNGEKIYQRKTDKLAIGDYRLVNLVYYFFDNKLYNVVFKIKGKHDSNGILNVLRKEYGNGEAHPDYADSFVWFGEKVTMLYLHNADNGNTEVQILSKKMDNLVFEGKNKREAAATSDL